MEVVAGRIRRGALLTLVVAVLLGAPPGVAQGADVVPDAVADGVPDAVPDAGPDEATDQAPPDDQPPPTETTTLMLQPVCADDDLQRFAVKHMAGPATEYSVRAAGTADGETFPIAVGETQHFWVEAAQSIVIEWADGSASAAAASEACSAPPAPPAVAPSPAPPSASRRAAEQAASEAPEAPEPTAAPAPDATPMPQRSERASPPAAAPDGPTVAPRDAAEPQDAQGAPRPRPDRPGGAYVCPGGWIPVDRDEDGRIEPSDECEVFVATGADGGPVRTPFTTVALLVTIGLLVTSIAVGALSRRALAR